MPWIIAGDAGDARHVALANHETVSWVCPLLSYDEQLRQVLVAINDAAMDRDRKTLSERIDLARRTSGRSEVERVLDWSMPPSEITVGWESVQHFGSGAGPRLGS
jgi:hypothetical protein